MQRLVAALVLACLCGTAHAVILDDEDRIEVQLADGTSVLLYGQAVTSPGAKLANRPVPNRRLAASATGAASRKQRPGAKPVARALPAGEGGKYYYLPVNLRLSQRADGTPEFLFLKFTSESRDRASGGLMHFLMNWGLTKAQEDELRATLKEKHGGAQLMGPVPVEPEGETGSFRIVSATLGDDGLTTSLVTSGKAPLLPGAKAAAASRLTATGAQLLAASFEKTRSITDLSIALDFSYHTLTPAAKGTITFNWEKLEIERKKFEAEYKSEVISSGWFFSEKSYSYNEIRQQYKFLEEKKIVDVQWMEARDDERLAKIREAFFDYFLQSLTNPAPDAPPAPSEQDDKAPPRKRGKSYKFSQKAISAAFQRKTDVFTLEARFAVRRPHQLVGNLASWYDHVRDNPKCVASVNLNDPFFQHRDIRFILDLDAKEMFDEAINYVTVNVRKQRTEGHDFEDHVTIDAKYVTENGVTAALTYARGEDENPDVYQYQAQWSLKGGHVFPGNPTWETGNWEGVTLAPPVVPRTIELEGDLAEMTASDITRVTAQIHYKQFGKEIEQNIHVSPARGQALVEKRIFLDRDAKGYAYRLVVNHKTEGKLALDWSAQVGDDYIYASLPPDLLEEGSPVKQQAKAAAKDIINSAKEKVLNRFKELVGG